MKTRILKDSTGKLIKVGDFVSLAGNMTADDSMGWLPNGWTFQDDDIYEVIFDTRINKLSLKLPVKPDSEYNVKFMNHAVSLLYSKSVVICDKPDNYQSFFNNALKDSRTPPETKPDPLFDMMRAIVAKAAAKKVDKELPLTAQAFYLYIL